MAFGGAVTAAEVHDYVNNTYVFGQFVDGGASVAISEVWTTMTHVQRRPPFFDFTSVHSDCLRFGQQASVTILILITELLVSYKVCSAKLLFYYSPKRKPKQSEH
jgi:hypothetical protein